MRIENMLTELFDYVAYIMEGYGKWLYDIVTRKKSKRTHMRLNICKKCEHNKKGICDICGCIIKAKVRVDFDLDENGISIDGCPTEKW